MEKLVVLRRIVGAWLLVLAAAAVTLKAFDRVPALLSGTPHGARVFASLDDAEAAFGERIWLPAYHPDTLGWPPARIDVVPGRRASAAVRFDGRNDRRERLVVCQALDGGDIPVLLLPAAKELETVDVAVAGQPARLARVVAADGRLLHDLSWRHGARRLTLRYDGPADQLVVIGTSLERSHP